MTDLETLLMRKLVEERARSLSLSFELSESPLCRFPADGHFAQAHSEIAAEIAAEVKP